MTKSRKPSLTSVRKFLRRVAFNPRIAGPMRIIAAMEDSNYYERRAQVLIEEARAIRYGDEGNEAYDEKIIAAIRMLVLSSEAV